MSMLVRSVVETHGRAFLRPLRHCGGCVKYGICDKMIQPIITFSHNFSHLRRYQSPLDAINILNLTRFFKYGRDFLNMDAIF